jgi:hypothetical protein
VQTPAGATREESIAMRTTGERRIAREYRDDGPGER